MKTSLKQHGREEAIIKKILELQKDPEFMRQINMFINETTR